LKECVIVTNDFGCETLPVAFRIIFPFRTLVAVSHTHPGQDFAAGHIVRQGVEKVCAWAVTKVIFNSFALQALWIARLHMKLTSNVVHYGISAPDLRLPDDYPAKTSDCVDFVCVSRFVRWKGHRQLVESWKNAVELGLHNSRLIFVGDGESWDEIKSLVIEHGLQDSILMLGAKQNGPCYFNGADVAVQLSTEPEAFGLVALEAMSRNKPVIASNLGGLPEIVDDSITGVLVNPMDRDQVAQAIVGLAGDAEKRRRYGEAGYLRWRAEFTNSVMANRLEQVL
jgi:glycosyltransferase involved in cell wall biosynthesis